MRESCSSAEQSMRKGKRKVLRIFLDLCMFTLVPVSFIYRKNYRGDGRPMDLCLCIVIRDWID